jgi:hypothetical protein
MEKIGAGIPEGFKSKGKDDNKADHHYRDQ